MRVDLSEGLPHYPSAGIVGAMCGLHVLGSEIKSLDPIEANPAHRSYICPEKLPLNLRIYKMGSSVPNSS